MINIEKDIINVVNSIINTELSNKNMQDDLQERGMDSIQFIKIIIALEELFEIEFPDEKLLATEMSTLNQMKNVVLSELHKVKGSK